MSPTKSLCKIDRSFRNRTMQISCASRKSGTPYIRVKARRRRIRRLFWKQHPS